MKTTQQIFRLPALAFSAAILGASFGLAGCSQTNQAEQVSLEDHNASLARRDSVINDLLGAFQEVETTLDAIAEREQILASNDNSELNASQRDAVLADIEALGAVLSENRDKITELEKRLKDSGIQASVLRKKVNQLTAEVDNRWADIRALESSVSQKEGQIVQLSSTVDSVQRSLVMRDEYIAVAEMELEETSTALDQTTDLMNQAYMASGTRKELKEKGLLDTRLIGPTTLSESLPTNAFQAIDIRETGAIALGSEKAELITYHPEGSYKMVPAKDPSTQATLEIINPDEFWKVSKYLVVSLK